MYHEPYLIPYIPPYWPNKESLSEELSFAIEAHDIQRARYAFDTAFWNKIDLTPNWHHLLCTVSAKDAPMTRLLVAHGAKWTPTEARCVQELFPEEWPGFLATLRSSGLLVTQHDPTQPADPNALCKMTNHLLRYQPQGSLRASVEKKVDTTPALKEAFNRSQARSRFGRLSGRDLVYPENFDDLIKAAQQKFYIVTPRQFADIVNTLHKKYKSGVIPGNIVSALRTLKESGADSRLIDTSTSGGSQYLGRKEPGMAKVLYDLNILKPNYDLMSRLHGQIGAPSTSKLYWHPRDKNIEFFFQIHFELKMGQEMIDQRCKIPSYHDLFKKTCFPHGEPRKGSPFRRIGW